MATKSLRRLLRSRLFFFIPMGAHAVAANSATPCAAHKLKPMQGLLNHHWNMQGTPTTSSRTSHFSCLPLQSTHCLPSSSVTYHSSAEYDEDYLSTEEVDEDQAQQLVRSHSCSKLQGKQLVPSFKSLLYGTGSDDRQLHHPIMHHGRSQSGKAQEFAGGESRCSCPAAKSGSKYSRSWSFPSLRMMKLPEKAGSLNARQGGGSRKCAPKGHVAVYVEAGGEREVVPIAYLRHPQFEALLKRAEREFGFRQQGPGLRIPCSLSELHHTLHHIRSRHSHPRLTRV